MVKQSCPPTALLTRPLAQSQRFAAQLKTRFAIEAVISPLMQTEFRVPCLSRTDYAGLILTSETGVEAARRLAGLGQALPAQAFCVGDRTAQAAKAAGFQAMSANGDAKALIRMIQQSGIAGPLLHISGQDSVGEVAKSLATGGIETDSAIGYAQIPRTLTDEAMRRLRQDLPVVLPLFSPRSARLFAKALPDGTRPCLWIAAISPATAEAAAKLTPDRLQVSAHPDAENMLHAVGNLLSDDSNA